MYFLPAHRERHFPEFERKLWRRLLLASAAVGAACSVQPWIRVHVASLFAPFADVFGPPAWHGSAGFTCLCTCALVGVMTLAETPSHGSQQAVRPASLLLAVLTAAAVVLHASQGPGMLRGVSACWTQSFYAVFAAIAALLAACAMRAASGRRGPGPRRIDSLS